LKVRKLGSELGIFVCCLREADQLFADQIVQCGFETETLTNRARSRVLLPPSLVKVNVKLPRATISLGAAHGQHHGGDRESAGADLNSAASLLLVGTLQAQQGRGRLLVNTELRVVPCKNR
jgi:hypothetical protein